MKEASYNPRVTAEVTYREIKLKANKEDEMRYNKRRQEKDKGKE